MKTGLLLIFWVMAFGTKAQQLQFHYDFRHSLDPELTQTNFASITFEYFKGNDSTGSFLFKMQTDLSSENSNVGQVFLQVSKNIRYWKPKVELAMTYSGGLGISPPSFGYSITNTVGLGAAYPFTWKGGWFTTSLVCRTSLFSRPSYDPQFTFYFGRGFFNYRLLVAGSLVAWSENRNQGTPSTKELMGKKVAFFGDPQCWLKLTKSLSIGSRVNLFYHTLTTKNHLQIYPTLGLKTQF
ncbi:DUF5020 family protein [Spirosoma radiotolerans]|uniref:DUF5020 domain-containing protein n=1 Tax=Spirosoma radiotolerans TaxID=1379870 RepID=A0A0E3V5I3_9BACT|nr:DUF5020 family protein [Spirosoma radiotolerans]AKD53681.1 hypothetical protein SD10_00965 [Spirosoma radiotolerans]